MLGITGSTLIMDRGFCSGANLMALVEKQVPFIMPASRSFKVVKQALSRLRQTIARSQNLHLFKKKTVFVEPVELTVEGVQFFGYRYYSPQREQDERERFYRKLRETIDYLEQIELKPRACPGTTVCEQMTSVPTGRSSGRREVPGLPRAQRSGRAPSSGCRARRCTLHARSSGALPVAAGTAGSPLWISGSPAAAAQTGSRSSSREALR